MKPLVHLFGVMIARCSFENFKEGIMVKLNLEMPIVAKCDIQSCAYNTDKTCHAKAITVGDGTSPECDTFFNSSKHTNAVRNAGVGACKVSSCRYNFDLECTANEIYIGEVAGKVNCLSFSQES
jgi:hypothetical protein